MKNYLRPRSSYMAQSHPHKIIHVLFKYFSSFFLLEDTENGQIEDQYYKSNYEPSLVSSHTPCLDLPTVYMEISECPLVLKWRS